MLFTAINSQVQLLTQPSALVIPVYCSLPHLTQRPTVHQRQSQQGVSAIAPSIDAPTYSAFPFHGSFSTAPPVQSPSEQSQFSMLSDDMDDYV
ncbi:hypothetical protein PR048_015296 [Dryococelus australis]|uniref:Uncharacterized protein n=1 Tax=Dryococelus australis TaxID=614101 RepID=A0ABQ9HGJ5_9NEOP|nr:hypothetical protein PR048_015296 [Dryococelus australis]